MHSSQTVKALVACQISAKSIRRGESTDDGHKGKFTNLRPQKSSTITGLFEAARDFRVFHSFGASNQTNIKCVQSLTSMTTPFNRKNTRSTTV